MPSLVFPLIEFLSVMSNAALTADVPPGACVIAASGAGLVRVKLKLGAAPVAGPSVRGDGASVEPGVRALLWEARRQLQAYFAGELRAFDLPLDLAGRTTFQEDVLRACSAIPWGETVSYAELARRSGHPGTARAVGQVMATNPLALVVPCHRVVGSDGRLTGYGYGLAVKQRLLEMERRGVGWQETGCHKPNSIKG